MSGKSCLILIRMLIGFYPVHLTYLLVQVCGLDYDCGNSLGDKITGVMQVSHHQILTKIMRYPLYRCKLEFLHLYVACTIDLINSKTITIHLIRYVATLFLHADGTRAF